MVLADYCKEQQSYFGKFGKCLPNETSKIYLQKHNGGISLVSQLFNSVKSKYFNFMQYFFLFPFSYFISQSSLSYSRYTYFWPIAKAWLNQFLHSFFIRNDISICPHIFLWKCSLQPRKFLKRASLLCFDCFLRIWSSI